MSATTNQGAASTLSRWCSHSRPISYRNNLLSALGIHYLMSFGCGVEVSCQAFAALISTLSGLPHLKLSLLYHMLFLPATALYTFLLLLALLLNELAALLEQALYVTVFAATLFTLNYSHMASFYCTTMHIVESLAGHIWHNSLIRLVTPARSCTICKSEAVRCRSGECYKFQKGLLYDQIYINCECFKQHLANRMALARERDACKTFFDQSNCVTVCKYLWRPSLLEQFAADGCGVFDDDVLDRFYDMDRSMWTCTRLETDTDRQWDARHPELVKIEFARDNLDEVVTVPIRSPDRLFEMPELRFSFLKNRARLEGRGGTGIEYTPVVLLKRGLILAVAAMQIRFASKMYENEQALGLSLVLTTVVLYALSFLRERVTMEDIGGAEGRVARMLAVDAMSVGTNLIRYSNRDTSWTRYKGYGSVAVLSVDVLENILHNRSVVMGNKTVSLSREGTSMYIAEVSGSASLSVSGWRKADGDEIQRATAGVPAALERLIGG